MIGYLWRGCASSSTLLELLQEHFSQNHVILVSENNNISSIILLSKTHLSDSPEYRGEHDGHPVRLGLNVHGLVVPVVDGCGLVALLLPLLELEVALEDGGEAVPLQQARLRHDRLPLVLGQLGDRRQVDL